MEITEAHKELIERRIIEAIITGLKNAQLTESELPEIAGFTLDEIDNVTTEGQMLEFLSNLTRKWNVFVNVRDFEVGKAREALERDLTQEVLRLTKEGKVEEALNAAKSLGS